MANDWTPIPGYEGFYEITTDGQVRSLDRIDSIGRRRKGKALSLRWTDGYATVSLSKNACSKSLKVHALVLLTFLGTRPKGLVCRHLDGDQTNNAICNLAYGTQRDNMADMVSHGRKAVLSSEECWKAKLTNARVKELRELYDSGLISQVNIEAETGLSQSSVSAMLLGKTWQLAGGPLKKPAPKVEVDDELLDRLYSDRLTGMSFSQLEGKYGIKRSTIHRMLR